MVRAGRAGSHLRFRCCPPPQAPASCICRCPLPPPPAPAVGREDPSHWRSVLAAMRLSEDQEAQLIVLLQSHLAQVGLGWRAGGAVASDGWDARQLPPSDALAPAGPAMPADAAAARPWLPRPCLQAELLGQRKSRVMQQLAEEVSRQGEGAGGAGRVSRARRHAGLPRQPGGSPACPSPVQAWCLPPTHPPSPALYALPSHQLTSDLQSLELSGSLGSSELSAALSPLGSGDGGAADGAASGSGGGGGSVAPLPVRGPGGLPGLLLAGPAALLFRPSLKVELHWLHRVPDLCSWPAACAGQGRAPAADPARVLASL